MPRAAVSKLHFEGSAHSICMAKPTKLRLGGLEQGRGTPGCLFIFAGSLRMLCKGLSSGGAPMGVGRPSPLFPLATRDSKPLLKFLSSGNEPRPGCTKPGKGRFWPIPTATSLRTTPPPTFRHNLPWEPWSPRSFQRESPRTLNSFYYIKKPIEIVHLTSDQVSQFNYI